MNSENVFQVGPEVGGFCGMGPGGNYSTLPIPLVAGEEHASSFGILTEEEVIQAYTNAITARISADDHPRHGKPFSVTTERTDVVGSVNVVMKWLDEAEEE